MGIHGLNWYIFPKIGGFSTPKSSILIGLSTINHPFSGSPIFGNTQMVVSIQLDDSKSLPRKFLFTVTKHPF